MVVVVVMVEEDQDDTFVQVCLENCWWWHAVHPYCSAMVMSAIFLTSFLVEESYQICLLYTSDAADDYSV